MTDPPDWDHVSYTDELAANIRAERGRTGITQQSLAARMRRLGFTSWLYQTVSKVERGKRPITAPEVLGLAIALDTTIPALMGTSGPDRCVVLSSGDAIGSASVRHLADGENDGAIHWLEDDIRRPSSADVSAQDKHQ